MLYSLRLSACLLGLAVSLYCQSYVVSNFAGNNPRQEGAPGTVNFLRSPVGIATDAAGNIYFSEINGNLIRRQTPAGNITTIAGNGQLDSSGDGGPALDAAVAQPGPLVIDRPRNLLYFVEFLTNRVRRINLTTGQIDHVAGNGSSRFSGVGPDATRIGMSPFGVAVDPEGNLFISDDFSMRIYRLLRTGNTLGALEIFAGTGTAAGSGDGGPAASASFDNPQDLVSDGEYLYVNDFFNTRIRRIHLQTRIVTAFAGNGEFNSYGDNGPAVRAAIFLPDGLGVDAAGNILISDLASIRSVDKSGTIRSIVGAQQLLGFSGDGGPAREARIGYVRGIAGAANGDILLADTENNRIRRVRADTISTIAGTDIRDNGPAANAFLNLVSGVHRDRTGRTFIADSGNYRVRAVGTNGQINTVAGTGYLGSSNGNIRTTSGVAVDSKGNMYFVDSGNHRILQLQAGATTPRVFAGSTTNISGYAGDGASPQAARFRSPQGLAIDAQDNLYIADWGNNRIRKISADLVVSTVGGNGSLSFNGDNGLANATSMSPFDVAVDSQGNIFFTDDVNNRVRRISVTDNRVTTVAGNGTASISGDGGPAREAGVAFPTSVSVDAAGNLYIGHRGLIRRVNTNGTIVRIAGTGAGGPDRDSGPATQVPLRANDLQALADGSILVADSAYGRVRLLTPQRAAALVISSGNNSATPADQTVVLAVRVNDANGLAVVNEPVTFAVTSGEAKLSATTTLTGLDGLAVVTVSFGGVVGPVGIRATSGALTPANFTLRAVAPAPPAVRISANGVAGAPLSVPAVRALSANAIVSVFGSNFAPAGTNRIVGSSDVVDGRIPTRFADTCVLVGSERAPIYAVFAGQINFQVPAVAATGEMEVRVVRGCDTATAETSAPERVAVRAATPEFFYFQQTASGVNPVAAANALTGQPVGGTFTPAKAGDVITVYGTGFGPTTPALAAGQIPEGIARVEAPARVTLGGRLLPEANVLYVGIAPFNPGLYQVNLILPEDISDGDLPLQIQLGDQSSPAGGFLRVQSKGLAAAELSKQEQLRKVEQNFLRDSARQAKRAGGSR